LQLFSSFFHPNDERYKVLIEAKAFPSDHYAVESQLRMKNLDPAVAMICMEPKEVRIRIKKV
jgi:kynureninase